ncbi:uncharacterized protein DSM5745_08731 [Aspergillus mulundensis]|uniref:Uncharacterized protein n=1 Tax=Aspergillus mulundensis TaxID=1810919 RepID=A0A3D8R4W2_9EURO|nr:hypothetical protein DSM5745_08731 [Aspergillus mulundensis]RDW68971.1 hypothetical protein DSM5745_08731 [Aspergillus mulundensis]
MRGPGSQAWRRFAATVDDILAAQGQTQSLTTDEAHELQILSAHSHDPNFPIAGLERLDAFLAKEALFQSPEQHRQKIGEAKIEDLASHIK